MKYKRLLSWLLTFAMIAGMFVVLASAEGNTTKTITPGQDGTGSGTMNITLMIPAAPTAASVDKTSITLNAVDGCEYSKDGTNWQTGTEFTGLLPGTEYTFS